ncbi:hypothetical protein CH063_13780 [Colletotrichum higginsianum]|uniref:Uncharacterized protein n=1 Tax=Colletotrichum higginsianum (strain IMI 349063) TaxID=759273 RepID=H1VVU0_COLHI|nr:hypothetical protein CH063_13780 [Colletotrichum higginsianum]
MAEAAAKWDRQQDVSSSARIPGNSGIVPPQGKAYEGWIVAISQELQTLESLVFGKTLEDFEQVGGVGIAQRLLLVD